MRLHRFLQPVNLAAGQLTLADEELIKQLRLVLRLEIGDQIILTNGAGTEARAEIVELTRNEVVLNVETPLAVKRGPDRGITLYCAVLKRENFELVVQKATELGVTKIVPLLTERTVKLGLNAERLTKIIKEAVEQSGRTTVPVLTELTNFTEALNQLSPGESNYFFDTTSTTPLNFGSADTAVGLWIGPEGGWSEAEIKAALDVGLQAVSLGSLTLRAETAALTSLALAACA